MTDFDKSDGLAIANATILMALFDHLLASGAITPHDVRNILNRAADDLRPRRNMLAAADALRIIENQILPRFEKGIKKD